MFSSNYSKVRSEISDEQLRRLGQALSKSGYGDYLLKILDDPGTGGVAS